MASTTDHQEVTHDFRFFRAYKDGRLEFKFPQKIDKVPAGHDPQTGVHSKDVHISSDPPVSARIFLPTLSHPTHKLPLFFNIHGGAFCMMSAFSPRYHNFCSALAARAQAIIVSVEYGLFPDRPIPACYDDSWAALLWVATHVGGAGPDPWLNSHADFGRVIIGGHSAGGNIAHTLAVRIGRIGLAGVKVVGMILAHPYFGGTADDEMWLYMCPDNGGLEDPRLKPAAEDLAMIGFGNKVLIFVAEKDHLNVVGKMYGEDLKKSGWEGSVEIVESFGEGHCFHLQNYSSGNGKEVMDKFASFIKQE